MKISIHNIFLILTFATTNIFAQTYDKNKNDGFVDFKINIAGKTKGEITKDELLNSKGIVFDDSLTNIYRITTFRMALISKGSGEKDFSNIKNGELTNIMREVIGNASSGNKIYFEMIRCTNKNNETRMISPLSFVIK